MITFEEAKKIAVDKIGADYVISEESIIEKPYGWYFCSLHKKFVETGSYLYLEAGNGGFLVEKENGKVVEFGSAFSPDQNFKIYEKGLIGRNDLIILKVGDLHEAVRLLNRLQMTHVETKFANGVEWKIPKLFNEKQLKEAILKLPCTFKNQNFYFRYDELEKIDNSKCLDYKLQKH